MERKIICNCCGKQIETVNGIPKEDFIQMKKQWGYFSGKDGICQELCICESCYDAWIRTFRVPVASTEATELM